MKIAVLIPLLMLVFSCCLAEEALRRVCVDGDRGRVFWITEKVPKNVIEGGFVPEVIYADDGQTPKSLTWATSLKAAPVQTVVGRFQGHEIVDLTFPVREGGKANQPFEAKVLAYRVEARVSAPMLPFFILLGDNVRSYDQAFESDANSPFHLAVSVTELGNGVMWQNFTFRFGDDGAWLAQHHSGGRKQKTRVTEFKPDGTISSSVDLLGN